MAGLSKKQQERKQQIVEDVESKWNEVTSAVDDFNSRMKDLWAETVESAIQDYNAAVQQANEFIEEIGNELQEEYDNKSEKWQEGDKGQEFQSFMDEWQGVTLDEADASEPEDYNVDDPSDDYTTLDNLPNGTEG